MRIAFSTLGCPDFDWVDIYTMAKDLQFDGIEVRGIGRNIHAVTAAPFTPRRINQTIQKLSDLRLTIPCFSSNTALKDEEDREAAVLEITEYIELAHELGTPYIRVLADRDAASEGEVDDDKIAEALLQLADIAKGKNVTLLVETNGVYGDTARLRKLLDRVNRPEIAALWDIHHPYRFFGEDAEDHGGEPRRLHPPRPRQGLRGGKRPHRLQDDGRGRPARLRHARRPHRHRL